MDKRNQEKMEYFIDENGDPWTGSFVNGMWRVRNKDLKSEVFPSLNGSGLKVVMFDEYIKAHHE